MQQRISMVTLGVQDLDKSIKFYTDLGWKAERMEKIAFFQMNGMAFSLYPKEEMAKETLQEKSASGFQAFSLSHNVRSETEVNEVMKLAESVGAKIIKPAQKTFWGGYSGYFGDPDGFIWEVAHNPFWKLDEKGNVSIKKTD